MERPISTRIRYVSSKNIEEIISYVNSLPYMVQSVNTYFCNVDKKHYFVFILPDDLKLIKEVISGELD